MGWLIAAAGAFVVAWLLDRRRRVYADLETIPAAAVYAGRNEVKGRAWHDEPTLAHESRTPCVWWRYTLEEERREENTDEDGNTTTTLVWKTIEEEEDQVPHFELVDDSGSVRVVFNKASVSPRQIMSREFRVNDPRTFFQKMFSFGGNRTGKYRHTERGIVIGDEVFVTGEASLRDDVVQPQIDGGRPYLISTRSEDSHRSWTGGAAAVLVVLGIAAAGMGGFSLAEAPGAVAAVIAALLVAGSGTLIVLYNRLSLQVQSAARAWSLIDIQLARRHDLIPKLASAARGLIDHERVLLESLAIARTSLAGSAPTEETVSQADHEAGEQTGRIRQLLAVIEDYPELKANDAMLEVQQQIADSENRIAATRGFYNDSVTLLRNQRGTFPGVLVARFADKRRFALFGADGFERTVPNIEFDWDVGKGDEA